MENASKALLMAGGIFLAIALLTFGVYTYTSLNRLTNEKDEQTAQQQLVNFNKSYEAYNKSIMYGTDLISVINKANDNNALYNDDTYKIKIKFKLTTTNIYVYNSSTGKRENQGTFIATDSGEYEYDNDNYKQYINENSEAFDDFKRRLFKCTGVVYSNVTGRINSMSFEEVPLNDYEHK